LKKFLSFLIILSLILSTFSLSFAEILKDETIYVNLDHNGNAKDIKVVNRIYGESNDKYYVDYGEYEDIEPLADIKPIVEKDKIKWPLQNLKGQDIYYEANIDKELPMKIDIRYFLDGKEILGEELAGKSGNLKIDISIENGNNLTTQIQIPLNLDIFSNIKVENGTVSVVGKTMTVVYTHLPIGNGKFSLEARGENIELESMFISSTNSKMPLSGDLEDFSSGIDEMAKAFDKLEKGSKELNKGTISLKDGLKALASGIGEFYSGFNQINNKTKEISNGFNQFNSGFKILKINMGDLVEGIGGLNYGFKPIVEESNNIEDGMFQLKEGTANLDNGVKELNNGLISLNSNHKQLVELAQSLQDSQDPRVKALAEGMIGEGVAIENLSNGLNESYKGINAISENSNRLYLGYSEYNKGLNEVFGGYSKLNEKLQPMPKELENMYSGHVQLTEGLDAVFEGLDSMDNGISDINNNTKILPDKVGKLAEGQEDLTKGISKLNNEGIDKIKDTVEIFTENGGDKEDNYTSFVDNRNGNNSTCQFIMKTPAIKIENPKNEVKIVEKNNKSFLERLLDLFRG
jgi:X-X-X-Leu-X-X-Gly heptad repeat protein